MILLAAMLLLFLIRVPVGFAIGIAVLVSIYAGSTNIPLLWVAKRAIESVASYPLLAMPFFILTAELMNTTGITHRIYHFAHLLVGHMKGGLAQVNIVGSMIFAGTSGSAVADAAGLGKIEIKAMTEAGYDKERPFVATVTATSATVGPIIPPSIPLVVYGSMAEVSIGRLLIAGAIPGLLLGLSFMLVVAVLARRRNYPSNPRPAFAELLEAFRRAFFPLLTPVILIGGMMSGFFTPTEAGAVAAAYSAFLGVVVYREITLPQLWRTVVEAGVESGKILVILAMASAASLVLTMQQIPQDLVILVSSLTDQAWVMMILIVLLLLFIGLFIEVLPGMILVVPLLLVVVQPLGIDPIHLGIVSVMTLVIGLITPPVGFIMFITCEYAKVSIPEFVREAIPFYAIIFVLLMLVALVPEISLWLPNTVMGR